MSQRTSKDAIVLVFWCPTNAGLESYLVIHKKPVQTRKCEIYYSYC